MFSVLTTHLSNVSVGSDAGLSFLKSRNFNVGDFYIWYDGEKSSHCEGNTMRAERKSTHCERNTRTIKSSLLMGVLLYLYNSKQLLFSPTVPTAPSTPDIYTQSWHCLQDGQTKHFPAGQDTSNTKCRTESNPLPLILKHTNKQEYPN